MICLLLRKSNGQGATMMNKFAKRSFVEFRCKYNWLRLCSYHRHRHQLHLTTSYVHIHIPQSTHTHTHTSKGIVCACALFICLPRYTFTRVFHRPSMHRCSSPTSRYIKSILHKCEKSEPRVVYSDMGDVSSIISEKTYTHVNLRTCVLLNLNRYQ